MSETEEGANQTERQTLARSRVNAVKNCVVFKAMVLVAVLWSALAIATAAAGVDFLQFVIPFVFLSVTIVLAAVTIKCKQGVLQVVLAFLAVVSAVFCVSASNQLALNFSSGPPADPFSTSHVTSWKVFNDDLANAPASVQNAYYGDLAKMAHVTRAEAIQWGDSQDYGWLTRYNHAHQGHLVPTDFRHIVVVGFTAKELSDKQVQGKLSVVSWVNQLPISRVKAIYVTDPRTGKITKVTKLVAPVLTVLMNPNQPNTSDGRADVFVLANGDLATTTAPGAHAKPSSLPRVPVLK